jgi:Holliday junction resolvase-like predicted endonuclease
MVNLEEFEKLLLTKWTLFIDPKKLIAFVLTKVRDSELIAQKGVTPSQKKSIKITVSHFRASQNRNFTLWVEFVIPKPTGVAVGTCELSFDPLTGTIEHLQTLGNLLNQPQT